MHFLMEIILFGANLCKAEDISIIYLISYHKCLIVAFSSLTKILTCVLGMDLELA